MATWKIIFLLGVVIMAGLAACLKTSIHKKPDKWVVLTPVEGDNLFDIEKCRLKVNRASTLLVGAGKNKQINAGIQIEFINSLKNKRQIAKNRFALSSKSYSFQDVA